MLRTLASITLLFSILTLPSATAQDFSAAVEQNMDAALVITGTISATGRSSQSSGCCIDTRGYVLATAHQVVGIENIIGRLQNGKTFPLEVVEVLKDRELALLKADQPLPSAVRLGSAEKLFAGSQIFSIATPRRLDFSVAVGNVSNMNRRLFGHWAIQAEFRVSPGSSGGPVFNAEGLLIGVVYGRTNAGEEWTVVLPVDNAFAMLRRNEIAVPEPDLDNENEIQVIPAPDVTPLELEALEAYNRGVSARDTQNKIAAYQTAVNLLPKFYEAHFNLAVTLTNIGNIEKAITVYKNAEKLRPNSLETQRNLGRIYLRTKNFDEAEVAFKTAQSLAPDEAQSYNDLGEAYRRAGKMELAQSQYERAIELNPKYTLAHYNLAVVLINLNNKQAAITHFGRYLELAPTASDAETVRQFIRELKSQP